MLLLTLNLSRAGQSLLLFTLAAIWCCDLFLAPLQADEVDFNRDIRPILSENCFYCHGQDENKRQAGLRLDQRESALDFEALVAGEPDASGIIHRIEADDAALLMPPADSNRQLTPAQKRLLRRWIAEGGHYQTHWAFEPPQRPPLPDVKRQDWVRNPIDRFVLAKLEEENWEPSPEADRATLIKRLSIDLVGLPPTPAETAAFIADPAPDAYEKLVDRLMASPHYGERMALPWLDAARYADSNGFQQDGDTWQWIWRDWVVEALNRDLPFDTFTIWQLAGDLLPDATTEQKIASGFNRNHLLNGEGGAIAEEQRFVNLFDRMDTTSTTWLGLTMACAQCHDHKYDPITMQDYYRLMDAFNRVPERGTPQRFSARIRVDAPFILLPTEENRQRIAELENQIAATWAKAKPKIDAAFTGWEIGIRGDGQPADVTGLPKPVQALLKIPAGKRTDQQQQELASSLRKHFDQKITGQLNGKIPERDEWLKLKRQLTDYRNDQVPRVMVMSDDKPRKTHILDRGAYLSKLEEVTFNTPRFLPPLPDKAPRNRLGLAQWLVADNHPLTARVHANRLWQHFFGSGIVKTAEDFGVQSDYPVHRQLLDWLAVEFREQGWSQKKLNRLIVTSATYRQASRITPAHLERDPDNRLYARAARMRMPAMILRDWALAAAGLLVDQLGGQPVYPYLPPNPWESLAITKERDFTYPASQGEDLYRRSLYTFWRRTVQPANMFDASNRQACRVKPSRTSTPLHALTTLNDPTWVEAARVLAQRALAQPGARPDRIGFAFEQVVCRKPRPAELVLLQQAFEKQHELFRNDPQAASELLAVGESPVDPALDANEWAAMSVTCLAILNLDEALTRE